MSHEAEKHAFEIKRPYFEAAPALVRALCKVEWSVKVVEGEWSDVFWTCPECGRGKSAGEHNTGCTLDDALTEAGFSHEDREAVRISQ